MATCANDDEFIVGGHNDPSRRAKCTLSSDHAGDHYDRIERRHWARKDED